MNRRNGSLRLNRKIPRAKDLGHPVSLIHRINENRWFLIFFLISFIFLLLPGNFKLSLFQIPRTVLLAPLNLTANFFTNLSKLTKTNQELSLLATRLQMENNGLKEQLLNKGRELSLPEFSLQRVEIIGRDPATMINFLLIDRGESAGIKINQAVITKSGIFGKVIQASPWQSLVETMLSPDSKIAALDQRSRVIGVMTAYKGARLKMNYIVPDADIQLGDTIISSGVGGVFPKGLLIGTVVKIDNRSSAGGLFKLILIKPFVDMYAVETGYVITGIKTEEPKIRTKTENLEWEKMLEQLKINPPIEIKVR